MTELHSATELPTEEEDLPAKLAFEQIERLRNSIESVIRGKAEAVQLTLVTLFSEGHLLIEDVPGVGKTMLAQALARSLDCSFRRVQFTSDLLPSDILGVSVFQPTSGRFEFKPGPIFSNVLLADEINRATPKTQSAMLEAMNESQVSLDSRVHRLPAPFIVLATQNPNEHHGTYPLPESQLDRFLMRIRMGYPSEEDEKRLLSDQQIDHPIDSVTPVMNGPDVVRFQKAVRHVRIDESITDYIVRIVSETRRSSRLALGVSPRGALLLQRASQARALIAGRRYVVPDDVQSLVEAVLAHRVMARPGGRAESVLEEIVEQVAVPL
jgi:MoxR-like ATPase